MGTRAKILYFKSLKKDCSLLNACARQYGYSGADSGQISAVSAPDPRRFRGVYYQTLTPKRIYFSVGR